MYKKLITITIVSVATTLGLAGFNVASATVDQRSTYNYGLPVQICHSRQPQPSNGQGVGAQNNPYGPGRIVVKVSAIVDGGHEIHDGPVYNATNQSHWGDIIPPFEYGDGKEFSLNWTDEGKDIFFNDCQPKTVSPGATDTPVAPGQILSTSTVATLPATGGVQMLIGVIAAITTAGLLYGYRSVARKMTAHR